MNDIDLMNNWKTVSELITCERRIVIRFDLRCFILHLQ